MKLELRVLKIPNQESYDVRILNKQNKAMGLQGFKLSAEGLMDIERQLQDVLAEIKRCREDKISFTNPKQMNVDEEYS